MTAPGFLGMKHFEYAVEGGDPEVTFWRETVSVPNGAAIMHGKFPHVRMADRVFWCGSDLFMRVLDGPDEGETYALGCTRELVHDGQHVAHDRPGYPVAAWIVRDEAPIREGSDS